MKVEAHGQMAMASGEASPNEALVALATAFASLEEAIGQDLEPREESSTEEQSVLALYLGEHRVYSATIDRANRTISGAPDVAGLRAIGRDDLVVAYESLRDVKARSAS